MRRLLVVVLLAFGPVLCGDGAPKAKPNAGPSSWTAGPYQYDGAGGVIAIGSESFVYDKIVRLKSATVHGPDLTTLQTQTYTYDPYGNLIETARLGQTVDLAVDARTNRLNAAGYDAAGNVTSSGTYAYAYDALGMMNAIRVGTGGQPRVIYAYTADDERLLAFDVAANTTHWTLRGLDHKVLRDFQQNGVTWSVERDYVYRDGLLLAAMKPDTTVEHYTLDHLGTPRLVTDAAGNKIGQHAYWPFGEEWTAGNAQEGAPLKFTGHERDADPANGTSPLDYMHARYYRPDWGRFLSVDPTSDSSDLAQPNSWNRYSYVLNRPTMLTDPDGRHPAVLIGIAIAGAILLSADHANAPTHGDLIFRNDGPAGSIRGAVRALGIAGAGNAVTSVISRSLDGDRLSTRQARQRSNEAAERAVTNINAGPRNQRPATIIGATNRSTRQTIVGRSSPGPTGCCAETDAATQLGGNTKDIVFSKPIRPRTGETVPVCTNCQQTFAPSQFPPNTPMQPPK